MRLNHKSRGQVADYVGRGDIRRTVEQDFDFGLADAHQT